PFSLRGNRRARWSFGERHLGNAVRVLKGVDQPLACPLLQHLDLNTLPGLWDTRRRFSADHCPANVCHRNCGSQKPNIGFSYRQCAVFEHKRESIVELALDLRPLPPPPADYVHHITILGEEVRIGLSVVLIPGILLSHLDSTNLGYVFSLIGSHCRRHSCDYNCEHHKTQT